MALLSGEIDGDDDRADLSEEELAAIEDAQFEASTASTAEGGDQNSTTQEKNLLNQMEGIAEQFRGVPDARVRYLIKWIKHNMCPGVRLPGERPAKANSPWNHLRLLIPRCIAISKQSGTSMPPA